MTGPLCIRGGQLIGLPPGEGGGEGGSGRDLWIEDGRIAAITRHGELPPGRSGCPGRELTLPAGSLVSAGWIDGHVHVFGEIGIGDPDAVGVAAGVTGLVDAGSAGPLCVGDLLAQTAAARTDVYALCYLEAKGAAQIAGIPAAPAELTTVPVGALVRAVEEHPGVVRGVKADALADLGIPWVRLALAAAELVGRPLMVHIGNFPNNRRRSVEFVRSTLRLLRPGDIVTHVYTPEPGGLFDDDGQVLREALDAQERGVLFDLGYAFTGYSVELARRGRGAGLVPGTVSTDLQVRTARRRVRSLADVMSRLLAVGWDLDEVVGAVTDGPRRAFGLPPVSLRPGDPADLTVFRLVEVDETYQDGTAASWPLDRRIEVQATVKGGLVVTPDPDAATRPGNLRWLLDVDGPGPSDGDPAVAAVLRGLAALLEAVPVTGELVQLAWDQLVGAHGAERSAAAPALYRSLGNRPTGPQLGWMVADAARTLGPERVAARLETVAGRMAAVPLGARSPGSRP